MIMVYYLCILIISISSHALYSAQAAAPSLPPTYMQQYAHCSGIVYKTFAGTITSLTPEQAAQMAHGPQHFVTAHVVGTAFIESLNQQRADHGSLDAATLTTVAHVHAATLQELTAAGHLQGLATRDDVQKIMEETKKMREELAQIKLKLAEAVGLTTSAAPARSSFARTALGFLGFSGSQSPTNNISATAPASPASSDVTAPATSVALASSGWFWWLNGSSSYNFAQNASAPAAGTNNASTTTSVGSTTSATPAATSGSWVASLFGGPSYDVVAQKARLAELRNKAANEKNTVSTAAPAATASQSSSDWFGDRLSGFFGSSSASERAALEARLAFLQANEKLVADAKAAREKLAARAYTHKLSNT
jgi:hypothetical protein